jgi:hypothetical protein
MPRASHPALRRLGSLVASSALATTLMLGGAAVGGSALAANTADPQTCSLGPNGAVKHVVYVQFDNTHFLRDTPNVPSDLEQMPNLLNFMKDNGTLLTNDHTVLISHTAGGILSSLTGVYPDRHGQIVSNSNVRFNGAGFSFPSSFGYWTDPIVPTTTVPNMVTPTGANAPAPWVPYTRAGCNFGAVATANTVLENANAVTVQGGPTPLRIAAAIGDTTIFVGSTGGFSAGLAITLGHNADAESATVQSVSSTQPLGPRLVLTAPLTMAHAAQTPVYGPTTTNQGGDLTKVFGANTPQWNEGSFSQTSVAGTADRTLAQTDFVGFAVHCAQGSSTCASGQNDVLPDEPGGYTGFKGLFGAQAIDPLITGQPASVAVTGLDGNPVVDPFGQPGFPGFDGMSAAASLAYTAGMQEAGVPVTFAYISDAHDGHGVAGNAHNAFGPGSAEYVAQLKAYDDAFGAFFDRLAKDHIDKSNTMFVFTVDEGDHFVGSQPANPGCDGVTVPCDWNTLQDGHPRVGEINGNIDTLLFQQHPELFTLNGSGQPIFDFTVHGDDAPTFYISGNPAQTAARTRAYERATADLTAHNPYTGATDKLMVAMADQAEMKILHMYTAGDPLRDPNFAYFGDPNYFLTDFGLPAGCGAQCINPPFAWNHGDIQPEIANTWLGFVGPGIRNLGQTGDVWTDHTDVRPTMLLDLGLASDYTNDGRAITQILDGNAVPLSVNQHRGVLEQLGAAYKQLDAPFGRLSMASLKVSTAGIPTGTTADDSAYTAMDAQLGTWLGQRDALAGQISAVIYGAHFGGTALDVHQAMSLIGQANTLIAQVEAAAP